MQNKYLFKTSAVETINRIVREGKNETTIMQLKEDQRKGEIAKGVKWVNMGSRVHPIWIKNKQTIINAISTSLKQYQNDNQLNERAASNLQKQEHVIKEQINSLEKMHDDCINLHLDIHARLDEEKLSVASYVKRQRDTLIFDGYAMLEKVFFTGDFHSIQNQLLAIDTIHHSLLKYAIYHNFPLELITLIKSKIRAESLTSEILDEILLSAIIRGVKPVIQLVVAMGANPRHVSDDIIPQTELVSLVTDKHFEELSPNELMLLRRNMIDFLRLRYQNEESHKSTAEIITKTLEILYKISYTNLINAVAGLPLTFFDTLMGTADLGSDFKLIWSELLKLHVTFDQQLKNTLEDCYPDYYDLYYGASPQMHS